MKKNILIIIILCVVTFALSFYLDQGKPLQISRFQENIDVLKKEMPAFQLETLEGNVFDSEALKGKHSLVHFWATWCPPCVAEFPSLVAFARDYPNIEVITISTDFKKEAVEQFLKRHIRDEMPENLILLTDLDSRVTRDVFKTTGLPETVVITPDLKISRWYKGDKDWRDETFRKEVLAK